MVSLCRSGSHKHKLDADRLFSNVQIYSDSSLASLNRGFCWKCNLHAGPTQRDFSVLQVPTWCISNSTHSISVQTNVPVLPVATWCIRKGTQTGSIQTDVSILAAAAWCIRGTMERGSIQTNVAVSQVATWCIRKRDVLGKQRHRLQLEAVCDTAIWTLQHHRDQCHGARHTCCSCIGTASH